MGVQSRAARAPEAKWHNISSESRAATEEMFKSGEQLEEIWRQTAKAKVERERYSENRAWENAEEVAAEVWTRKEAEKVAAEREEAKAAEKAAKENRFAQ